MPRGAVRGGGATNTLDETVRVDSSSSSFSSSSSAFSRDFEDEDEDEDEEEGAFGGFSHQLEFPCGCPIAGLACPLSAPFLLASFFIKTFRCAEKLPIKIRPSPREPGNTACFAGNKWALIEWIVSRPAV